MAAPAIIAEEVLTRIAGARVRIRAVRAEAADQEEIPAATMIGIKSKIVLLFIAAG